MNSDRIVDEVRSLFKNEEYGPACSRASRALELSSKPGAQSKLTATGESTLRRARLSALILSGKAQEAAKIAAVEREHAEPSFERVYALYAGSRLDLALEDVRALRAGTPESSESFNALRHLEAQILYRMGFYSDAATTYGELHTQANEPQRTRLWQRSSAPRQEKNLDKLRTNLCASWTLSGRAEQAVGLETDADDATSYETMYNQACALIELEEFAQAEAKLLEASTQCQAFLEKEEYPPEEIEDELALFRAQIAFILQKKGELQAAKAANAEILRKRPSDISVVAVASNNITSIRDGDKLSLFDLLKKMRSTQVESLELRLTERQRRIMGMNRCLIQYELRKFEETRADLSRLRSQFPGDIGLLLTETALVSREGKFDDCLALLDSFSQQFSESRVEIELARAQIQIMGGKFHLAAATLMQSCVAERPGTLATVSLLLEKAGKVQETIAFLKEKAATSSPVQSKVLRELSAVYQRHSMHAESAGILTSLLAQEPGNLDILASLVDELSHVDLDEAERHAQDLEALIDSGVELDVDTLEAGPAPAKLGERKLRRKAMDANLKENGEKKRKRKKKKRLPKDYQPGDPPPDPERWLPKSLRSTTKKRKTKRTDVGKGSQGADASARGAEHLDIANTAPGTSTSSTTAQTAESQRPKGAKKKNTRRRR